MPKLVTCRTREEKEILVRYLRTGEYPNEYTKEQKRSLRRKAEHFMMVGDDICFKAENGLLKAVFEYEVDLIQHLIHTEHLLGHAGINKMVDLINQKYYGISKAHIAAYIGSCESCIRFNSLRTIQPVYMCNITRKYDRYIIDCIDLRRYSSENDGYSWILNIIDTFTKYLWSIKLKNKTAIAVTNSLKYIFMNYGVPFSIQADNGKEFKNSILREFLTGFNIQIIHGRPRNPKSQGQVERVNQTVKRWLAKKLYETGGHR